MSKYKFIELEVTACFECPYLAVQEGNICKQTDNNIMDVYDMPDWCPLPDEE